MDFIQWIVSLALRELSSRGFLLLFNAADPQHDVMGAVLSFFTALSVGPDALRLFLSHLSQLMMMFPSARHMELVVLSTSLFQAGPREYFGTVL